MNIQCLKDKLKEAVAKAEKVAVNNPSLPILSCILLIAKNSSLTLRSTNLDLGVEVKMPCKTIEEGTVAVPSNVLKSVLSTLPGDDKLELSLSGSHLKISSGTSTSTIIALDHGDFPSIPRIEDGTEIKLKTGDFIGGLKSVVYSTAPSSMKPEFSSVHVYRHENMLVFVATDSFRLAEAKKTISNLPEFEPILIPHRNVGEIVRLFDGQDGEIFVQFSKTQLSISNDSLYLTSRLVDSSYPDYKQIIPKEFETTAVILKRDFENALRMSTIFSDKFNKVKFSVIPSKKLFQVSSSNASVGESTTDIGGKIEGEEITIHFNERYVADVLNSIKGESIEISMLPNRPMIIKDSHDTLFQYLVMPVAA